MSYKDVQELIEVPTIAYLCSLFHEPLGTPDFEIEVRNGNVVQMFSIIKVASLDYCSNYT